MFLSDGEASLPRNAISEFKANPRIMEKIKMQTVAFGEDKRAEKVLKPLAEKMGGVFVKALDDKDLGKAFTSMVANIYQQ